MRCASGSSARRGPFRIYGTMSQEAARAWGARTTPHLFVLDPERRIVYAGAPDADHRDPSQRADWLRTALDAVLEGDEPSRPTPSRSAARSSGDAERGWPDGDRATPSRPGPRLSANLGPGYDVLATALTIELELEVTEDGRVLRRGRAGDPADRSNLCVRAFESLRPADGSAFRIRSEIPLAAGLGSSAAAIVAGLLAADHLYELAPDPEDGLPSRPPSSRATRQRRRRPLRRLRALRRNGRQRLTAPVRLDPPQGVEAVVVDPRGAGARQTRRAGAIPEQRPARGRRSRTSPRPHAARARDPALGPDADRPTASPTGCTSPTGPTSIPARLRSSGGPRHGRDRRDDLGRRARRAVCDLLAEHGRGRWRLNERSATGPRCGGFRSCRSAPTCPSCDRRDRGSLSLWSEDSFLSIASNGSALSIGSVGSFASIGSIGSACSAFSVGSAGSAGSVSRSAPPARCPRPRPGATRSWGIRTGADAAPALRRNPRHLRRGASPAGRATGVSAKNGGGPRGACWPREPAVFPLPVRASQSWWSCSRRRWSPELAGGDRVVATGGCPTRTSCRGCSAAASSSRPLRLLLGRTRPRRVRVGVPTLVRLYPGPEKAAARASPVTTTASLRVVNFTNIFTSVAMSLGSPPRAARSACRVMP